MDTVLIERKMGRMEALFQTHLLEQRGLDNPEDPVEYAVRTIVDLEMKQHRQAMFYALILTLDK